VPDPKGNIYPEFNKIGPGNNQVSKTGPKANLVFSGKPGKRDSQ